MNDNNNNSNISPAKGDPATFGKEHPQTPEGVPPSFPIPEAEMRSRQRQTSPTSVQNAPTQSTPAQAQNAPTQSMPAQAQNAPMQSTPAQAKNAPTQSTPAQAKNAPTQSMPAQAQNAPVAPSSPVSGSQPSKKNRYLLIGSLLVLSILLGGVVFAMWWLPGVTLYQEGSQNVNQGIGGGGIVFPRQQLDISYPTSELVKAVFVKAGDLVTPKQSLLQLDASQLNIQIQQAAADMAAAQAALNSVAVTGTAPQIAQAQQAYQIAKNRYNAMVAQAQSPTLRNGNLISPMSGVVTAVNVNPGEVVAANVPLITIMDESTVIVHAKIPLSNLGQVHLGQQATVTPSALPSLTMQGTVSSIIPQADPQTDTFEVWVSVTNTNRMLLPGMSAFVHL